MPQLQVVDLNPSPRTETTPLEKTLSSFANRYTENRREQQESDALSEIYEQYKQDGDNLGNTIKSIQTKPGLSPTTRVNTINQLLKFQEHNTRLQNTAAKNLETQAKAQAAADKAAADKAEKEKKAEDRRAQLADIELKRGLEKGSLAAYEDNVPLAERTTRPEKLNQGDTPIKPDQLRRIQYVESKPEFATATTIEKAKMLRDAEVSRQNIDSVLKPFEEADKIEAERGKVITKKTAEDDIAFYQEQVQAAPRLFKTQQTLDAANALNEEGATGGAWDQAMQKAGLLQYTSEGFREYASYAKEMVKNQNIKNVIGSQISQMEFGFFRDATISERFSKEANRQIIRKEQAAVRYEKLYADIANNLVAQNNGQIPERFQEKVNQEFAKQSPKITSEIKEAAADFNAIQNVPKGFVLMYDKKRRPLHVKANEVEQATRMGASLK